MNYMQAIKQVKIYFFFVAQLNEIVKIFVKKKKNLRLQGHFILSLLIIITDLTIH